MRSGFRRNLGSGLEKEEARSGLEGEKVFFLIIWGDLLDANFVTAHHSRDLSGVKRGLINPSTRKRELELAKVYASKARHIQCDAEIRRSESRVGTEDPMIHRSPPNSAI